MPIFWMIPRDRGGRYFWFIPLLSRTFPPPPRNTAPATPVLRRKPVGLLVALTRRKCHVYHHHHPERHDPRRHRPRRRPHRGHRPRHRRPLRRLARRRHAIRLQ